METHIVKNLSVLPQNIEIIERKGTGHPDTLADGLAEALSRAYSNYTLNEFGAILHHNFDKVGLLGGRSYVAFRSGHLDAPIRVLLNGRATTQFGDISIPVIDLLEYTAKNFLKEKLPLINPEKDLVFHNNISTGSSPGHVEMGKSSSANRKSWFTPSGLHDLRERKILASNDTSIGYGYWPLTSLEKAVLVIEKQLTQSNYSIEHAWLGTDIKIMACRIYNKVNITMCIPQIANYVNGLEDYKSHLSIVGNLILNWVSEMVPNSVIGLSINTKDNFDLPELYLTAIGSSIESGDEGLVGRGNRPNGLIAMCRPYSMEGVCGKNPVYHVGKLYNIVALDIAKRLYEEYKAPVTVCLAGQEGRLLKDPWQVIIETPTDLYKSDVDACINSSLEGLSDITSQLLAGKIELF